MDNCSNFLFDSQIGNENHKYTVGFSFKHDVFNEILLNPLTNRDLSKTETVPGAYLQYTYNNQSKLVVLAGIRADYHNKYGAFVTPRIHAKYDLLENTKLRASIGKGYRTANVIADNSYLLASAKEFDIASNLEMEEALNIGVNLTQYFNLFGRELSISGEFYRTDFQNQVVVDMDTDFSKVMFYNLQGESFANNYQIETTYEILKGWTATAAMRYSDVQMTINNELRKKPLINDYKGLITTSYSTPLKKWQFDFTAQFNGGGRVPETPVAYHREDSFDPYTIINAQVTKFFRTWEVYIGSENLTNFTQSNPIIAAANPTSSDFDATKIWGPVHGRKMYIGFRFAIDREE